MELTKKEWDQPPKQHRFLQWVEKVGNKFPQPFLLFIICSLVLLVIAQAMEGTTFTIPGEGREMEIVSLLNRDGFVYIISHMLTNFINFPLIPLIVIFTLAIGVGDKAGLYHVLILKFFRRIPDWALYFVFLFVSINGNIISDAALILLPSIGAILFSSKGKNPILAVMMGYAGYLAGLSANTIIAGTDVLMSGITQSVLPFLEITENVAIHPACNWFFMGVSSILLPLAGTYITIRFVEPLANSDPSIKWSAATEEEKAATFSLTQEQRRGLRFAAWTSVVYLALVLLLVFDWRIGLVAAAGVLIYLAAAELALRKSAALSGVRQHTQESLVESVLEYIQGMGIVKAFGLERDSTQSIGSAIKASCRDNLKLTKASVPYDAIKQAVVRVFSVLLLLASVWFWLDGSLPLAYGLILVIASFMVFNDLENAGNIASLLQMLAASMDTANSIDDTPVMDEKGADITPKSSEIVFNKVDFSYADRKILDQVSFTITEKTTTAIVGPSGAGKTTMCNLIARFWDVNAGKITIGGTDVRDFKLDSLMKNISMVFQSVYLFADTIENNIKFGCPDATHEQVVEAAKKACCHNFISALPDGYDTVIGEGGGTLSGGEKQRISIARAMLKDAPIIILDEATSSVDPENEDELQRAIEALTHDKTIIMIAHRLKTVRNADQILVLDNAHIVQRGTHAELIQQKGLYADFVSARQEAIGWKLAQ